MNVNFKPFAWTPELREAARNSRKAREEQIKLLYRTEYAEDSLWVELAQKRGVKLPLKMKKPTTSSLNKFARSIGLQDGVWEEGLFGIDYKTSLKAAINKQQKRLGEGRYETLRAMCGYMLEQHA